MYLFCCIRIFTFSLLNSWCMTQLSNSTKASVKEFSNRLLPAPAFVPRNDPLIPSLNRFGPTYPRLSDSVNSISKEEEQILANCRLQLECTSPTIPKQLQSSPNSPRYPKESRVRVPILSARGPQGVPGMPGPPGPRGVRGPPGQCTENTNFSSSHAQMHRLLRQMNKLRMHVAFFAGLEYNIVDKPTELNPKVIMNRVITNVGQVYDAVTGEFTAPVDGIYVLSVAISAQGKSKAAVRLMHNEQPILDLWSESSPWSTTSNQAIL
ncbi:hypothetical protein EG68_04371, partial [Paragonimus skrjabini miyazakii]